VATPVELQKINSTPSSPEIRKLTEKTLDLFKNIYTMHYRHNSGLASLNFVFNGNLQGARERSLQHCKIMGYRQIWVLPFLVDMDTVEENQLGTRTAPNHTLGHPSEPSTETSIKK